MADCFDLEAEMDGPMKGPRKHARPTKPYRKGHAWFPGTGPAGETCRSCRHSVKREGVAGSYHKCALMRAHWTGGGGTDIRLKDPACRDWQKKEKPAP